VRRFRRIGGSDEGHELEASACESRINEKARAWRRTIGYAAHSTSPTAERFAAKTTTMESSRATASRWDSRGGSGACGRSFVACTSSRLAPKASGSSAQASSKGNPRLSQGG
jgi:hypothetical protein